jgi:hypothetical protein
MKLENVKVGETYTLKVGKNVVAVRVMDVDAKGKITVSPASGKMMTVADAGRLTVRTVAAGVDRPSAKGAAHGAPRKASTPKATKIARGRNVGQQGAPQAKEKRVGLVDAAILVLHEAGNKPMNVKEIVEAVLAKGIWKSNGKTPAATLYSCILREIQKKGAEARFKKVDRGLFALVG